MHVIFDMIAVSLIGQAVEHFHWVLFCDIHRAHCCCDLCHL